MAKKAAKKTPADSRQKKATKKAVKITKKKESEKPIELTADEKKLAAEAALQKRELDHLHTIQQMNERVVYLSNAYESAKAESSFAKKQLDEAASALSLCISQGPPKADPQKTLPFDDGGEVIESTQTPASESPAADAWKSVRIGEAIKLTPKQAETLESHGIRTVGQFEEVRSGQLRDYPDGLASLKGVGGVTITKWENDIIDWLMKNAREKEPDDNAQPDDKKAKSQAETAVGETAQKTPPAEWQLIPFNRLLKLSDKHTAKINDMGVTTLGSLHLIMNKANEAFPGGISDLPLPAKTIADLEADLIQLFADMGVPIANEPVDDSPAA